MALTLIWKCSCRPLHSRKSKIVLFKMFLQQNMRWVCIKVRLYTGKCVKPFDNSAPPILSHDVFFLKNEFWNKIFGDKRETWRFEVAVPRPFLHHSAWMLRPTSNSFMRVGHWCRGRELTSWFGRNENAALIGNFKNAKIS